MDEDEGSYESMFDDKIWSQAQKTFDPVRNRGGPAMWPAATSTMRKHTWVDTNTTQDMRHDDFDMGHHAYNYGHGQGHPAAAAAAPRPRGGGGGCNCAGAPAAPAAGGGRTWSWTDSSAR